VSAYLSEIRTHWRPLLAAFLGMGSGMSVVGVITSTIVPTLIADAGWSPADFAKVGSTAIFMALAFPFIGRLTDIRRALDRADRADHAATLLFRL
jgi:MFS family permease